MDALETLKCFCPLTQKLQLSAVTKRAIIIRFVWKSIGYEPKIDAFSYSPLKKKKESDLFVHY